MRIVNNVRVHTGFTIETQLFRCKRWIIECKEDALPEQHVYYFHGYNALPEPHMTEFTEYGFVSLTSDPYELKTHDALIDTLNLQLLNTFECNIQENLTFESKMGDREVQRRMISWVSKYGLPWGKTEFNEVICTGCAGDPMLRYGEKYNLSNLEETYFSHDMYVFEMPLLVIAHELAKIEMLAQTLLNHEDFSNVNIPALFHPKVTYSIHECDGEYTPTMNAASILDAMQIQILHLAQYEQGDPIKFCKCCGGAFRPIHGKQDYCLSPCNKDMASKRRTRAKSKENGSKG